MESAEYVSSIPCLPLCLQLLLPAGHCLRNDADAEQRLSTERSAIHTNLGGTPATLSDQQLGESRSH